LSLRADIVEELDELTARVVDIVELARGSKPDELDDDVRLDRIVEAVAERAQVRAGDSVTLRVDADATVVRGAPQRIQRAVANLSTTPSSGARPAAPSSSSSRAAS
jgi:two-component system, OmpR family, sensor histidine kinase MprB